VTRCGDRAVCVPTLREMGSLLRPYHYPGWLRLIGARQGLGTITSCGVDSVWYGHRSGRSRRSGGSRSEDMQKKWGFAARPERYDQRCLRLQSARSTTGLNASSRRCRPTTRTGSPSSSDHLARPGREPTTAGCGRPRTGCPRRRRRGPGVDWRRGLGPPPLFFQGHPRSSCATVPDAATATLLHSRSDSRSRAEGSRRPRGCGLSHRRGRAGANRDLQAASGSTARVELTVRATLGSITTS